MFVGPIWSQESRLEMVSSVFSTPFPYQNLETQAASKPAESLSCLSTALPLDWDQCQDWVVLPKIAAVLMA